MSNEYPILNNNYIFRQYILKNKYKGVIYGLYDDFRFDINKNASEIISLFNGVNSTIEIHKLISTKYPKINKKQIVFEINNVIDELFRNKIISFRNNPLKKRILPKKIKMRSVLDNVYIRLTDQCNLKCKHCSVDANPYKNKKIKLKPIYKLIDEIYEMMVTTIIFTGGEPTLVTELPEIIAYASKKPLKVVLMTNGLNITKEYAILLVKNGLKQVNISLDGFKAISHDWFRGVQGAFRQAINAINHFTNLGILVETTTVVNKRNSLEYNELLVLGQKKNLMQMKFLPIIPLKRGITCNYEESFDIYEKNISLFNTIYDDSQVIFKNMKKKVSSYTFRCSAGSSVIAINSNGDVLPCNNFEPIVLGNIYSNSLKNIYNYSNKIEILHKAIKIENSECENCNLLNYCHGGCAMVSYSYNNGIFNKCDITRKVVVENKLNKINKEKVI